MSYAVDPSAPFPTTLDQLGVKPSDDAAAAQAVAASLSDDQKYQIHVGIIKAWNDPRMGDNIKNAADAAAKGSSLMDRTFLTLYGLFSGLDSRYGNSSGYEKWAPKVAAFMTRYRELVTKSKEDAMTLATNLEIFSLEIIPIIESNDMTRDQKIQHLDKWIEETNAIQSEGSSMKDAFVALGNDLAAFTGTFGSWADGQIEKDQAQIQDLRDKLGKVQAEYDACTEKFHLALVGLGLIAFGTAVAGVIFGPIGLAIGCFFGGVDIAAIIALAVQQATLAGEKATLNSQIDALNQDVKDIQKTKTMLEVQAAQSASDFGNAIQFLEFVWNLVSLDAGSISQMLKNTEGNLDLPIAILDKSLHAIEDKYSGMRAYLTAYAEGLEMPDSSA